jgi:uncharacterized protein (TIGR03435 family)
MYTNKTALGHLTSWASEFFLFIAIGLLAIGVATASARGSDPQSTKGAPVESAAGELPQFDVVDIKPVASKTGMPTSMGIVVYPGGRVVISSLSLKDLIVAAFNISYWQISGGDAWTGKTLFQVEAKAPESMDPPIDIRHTLFAVEDERVRQMLQSLLAERFNLKYHVEKRTGKVYLLERSGKTLRLQPAGAVIGADSLADGFSSIGASSKTGWLIADTSMPQLAKFLGAYFLHSPVIDKTGLTGYFDFRSKDVDDSDWNSGIGPSILPILPEAGLKLEETTGPVETFVIDGAEELSPN